MVENNAKDIFDHIKTLENDPKKTMTLGTFITLFNRIFYLCQIKCSFCCSIIYNLGAPI